MQLAHGHAHVASRIHASWRMGPCAMSWCMRPSCMGWIHPCMMDAEGGARGGWLPLFRGISSQDLLTALPSISRRAYMAWSTGWTWQGCTGAGGGPGSAGIARRGIPCPGIHGMVHGYGYVSMHACSMHMVMGMCVQRTLVYHGASAHVPCRDACIHHAWDGSINAAGCRFLGAFPPGPAYSGGYALCITISHCICT